MPLPVPPEPRDIKERIMKRRSACTGSGCDSFSVWFGNEFAKYLWDHWGRELGRVGVNWPRFLSILSHHTQEIIDWAIKGTLQWEELVRIITNDLSVGVKAQERVRGGILDYLA